MATSRLTGKKDLANYVKVAQLRAALKSPQFDSEYFERILRREGDINYGTKEFKGGDDVCLLHAAYSCARYDALQILMNHGADYTVTDSEGHTVLHRIIHEHHDSHDILFNDNNRLVCESILYAQEKCRNISNPRSKHGISHFHVACITNYVEAVEFFLENGVAVDETVNENSPIFAGFTALHFAVEFSCLETTEILLKRGAKVHLKNTVGKSPLSIAIEVTDQRILKLILKRNIDNDDVDDDFGLSNLHVACLLGEKSIVEGIFVDQKLDVNQAINRESPVCPGYTPLHFAATCNEYPTPTANSTLRYLLLIGADIEAKNVENVTPFDLCLQSGCVSDVLYVMSWHSKWAKIKLPDDKTRLMDLVAAMKSDDEFGKFLENVESIADLTVPADSPLWPGYTILHLAVIFTYKSNGKVEKCLDREADITKADSNNRTALHLAFYLQKFSIVKLLLKRHLAVDNPCDQNNLSHFHIACAKGNQKAVKRFLSNCCIDINTPVTSTIKCRVVYSVHEVQQLFIPAGSTALHINAVFANLNVTRMLVDHGADICAKDCNGFTPIHRLLVRRDNYFLLMHNPLLRVDELRDSIANCGLSHLHVACYFNERGAVKKLVDSGADVNALISRQAAAEIFGEEDYFYDPYGERSKVSLPFSSRYGGFTPLHFALLRRNTDIQRTLIERGAKVLVESPSENVPSVCQDLVISIWMDMIYSINEYKRQLGVSMLYVACYVRDVRLDLVQESLWRGEDVNAKCLISPRNTPLHAAIKRWHGSPDVKIELIELLLMNGADVTLTNDNGDTPLHFLDHEYPTSIAHCKSARLLLKSLKDFDVSIVDSRKISFFHYACMLKDVEVAEKFLENGMDVNKPVDYLADKYAGLSPLHFSAGYRSKHFDDLASQLHIIDLLLKNGADVHAVDLYGNTPIRSAASCGASCKMILDILIKHGANVNAENVFGETPLEVLIKSKTVDWNEIQCLVKHGSPINSYNSITQESYITKLFHSAITVDQKILSNSVVQNLIASEYVSDIDSEGRNFLHNFVALPEFDIEDYVELIGELVKRGCHINHQDNQGRTPLHIATWFRNLEGVLGLLKNGADVNVSDKYGRPAFAYCRQSAHSSCLRENNDDTHKLVKTFAVHFYKMEYCGLFVSRANASVQGDLPDTYHLSEIVEQLDADIDRAKKMRIGSTTLNLFDFGIGMRTEMIYPSMSLSTRLEVDRFFENIEEHELYELDYLLKFKHETARERLRLINSAVIPLSIILKNQLPDECCHVIASFLSSSDLKNVIATQDL